MADPIVTDAEFEQKIEQARRMGATEEEIASVVRSSARARDAQRRTEARGTQVQFKRPFENADTDADTVATALAYARGTPVAYQSDFRHVKLGSAAPSTAVQQAASAEFAATPVSETEATDPRALQALADNNAELAEHQTGVRLNALPPAEADDQTAWEHLIRERGFPYSVAAETVGVDDALEGVSLSALSSEELKESGSFGDAAMQLAMELIPFKGIFDNVDLARTVAELVPGEDDFVSGFINTLHAGGAAEKLREWIASAPPERRAEFAQQFVNTLNEKLGRTRTKMAASFMVQDILSEDFIYSNNPEDMVSKVLNTLGSVLAVSEIAYLARYARNVRNVGKKLHGTVQLARATNPTRARAMLRDAWQNSDDSSLRARWAIDKPTLAQTQLPKMEGTETLDDIPEGVVQYADVERLDAVESAVMGAVNRQEANLFTVTERADIIAQKAKEVEALHNGRIRPGLSIIAPFEDGTGARLRVVVGQDDSHGFATVGDALKYVTDSGVEAGAYRFMAKNKKGELVEFKPSLKRNADGTFSDTQNLKGEFFLQVNHDHKFSAFDMALFNDAPVVAGSWMGRVITGVTTPSAVVRPDLVGKFTRAYTREQGMQNVLDSMWSKLFTNYSVGSRNKINDAMLWAEEFGKKEGRNPTLAEVKAQFTDLTDKELGGFYQTRRFHDLIYRVQNNRLYNNWKAQGYQTIRHGTAAYHGKVRGLDGYAGKSVFDPATGETRLLDEEGVELLRQQGAQVMEIDIPVSSKTGQSHKLVLANPADGVNIRALSNNPLKYIPGYFTRMYEDAHIIQRVNSKALVDGEATEQVTSFLTAPTAKEAAVMVQREVDRHGARLFKKKWPKSASFKEKVALLKTKGVEYRVTPDSRLSDADRVAVDLERFQVEGRLFFDDRQQDALRDVYGNPAPIAAPIDSMRRVSAMVSRQVAVEDLTKLWKNQFWQYYGGKVDGLTDILRGRNIANVRASKISDYLRSQIRTAGKEQAAEATKALQFWEYIRTMEGSLGAHTHLFRRQAIEALEFVDRMVRGKTKERGVSTDLARMAGNFNLIDPFKRLAFFGFLVTRPLRQLILQGGQHLSLQALDPTYIGKWQSDSFSLLLAVKRLGKARAGQGAEKANRRIMARLMGLKEGELDLLVQEFSASGLVDTVDVHTFAGGKPKSAAVTPTTKLGKAAQGVKHTLQKPFDAMREMGFDAGEQYNVTASYLMALRRYMKENKLKSLKSLTRDDWDEVANRGSQYALAMHRANSARFQYGWLSLPTQFLQFSHKWMLTLLGASKTARKLGLGNQQFTVGEARKILLGQLVLFGGAGLGLREEVRGMFDSDPSVAETPSHIKDILSDGVLDWAIDNAMQALTDDPDYDLDTSGTFSGTLGFGQTIQMIGENVFENPAYVAVLGPSAVVAGRVMKGIQIAQTMAGEPFKHWSVEQRAQVALEAVAGGLMAGYSDFLKVRMANRIGEWTNSSGQGIGIEAKFNDLVMKGAFGVQPQEVTDYYDITSVVIDEESALKEDAKHHATLINKIITQWGQDEQYDKALAQLNLLQWAMNEYDEDGRGLAFKQAVMDEFSRLNPQLTPLWERIGKIIGRGWTPKEIEKYLDSDAIGDEQQRAILKQWWQQGISSQELSEEQTLQNIERERQFIEEQK